MERKFEYVKLWRKANPDKRRETERRYYQNNREKRNGGRKIARRRYREIHKEQIREYARIYRAKESTRIRNRESSQRWRKNNLTLAREQARLSYYRNHEKVKERGRRYYQANKEQIREYNHSRRFLKYEYFRKYFIRYEAENRAALEVFKQMVGPCLYKDRLKAKQILQQLGGQDHDDATS